MHWSFAVLLRNLGMLFGRLLIGLATAGVFLLAVRLVKRLLPLAARFCRMRWVTAPIPSDWHAIVERNVALSRRLTPDDRERLLRLAQVFLRDTPMEGCGGLDLTEEIRVTIAAEACLLLLHLDYGRYLGLRRVLVYPGVFTPRSAYAPTAGAIAEQPVPTLGQAWMSGEVILSWNSTRVGSENPFDGKNVVLHEFAHVLDREDGSFDGVPILAPPSSYRTWGYVFGARFEEHRQHAAEDEQSFLDPYGAKNRAEFFAVATETFFEKPDQFRERAPDVYEELRKFYRQDPAAASGSPAADRA